MARKAVRLVIEGRVQGVWFRASARDQAVRLGLAGWVRNLFDGRVETHAEGPEEALQQYITWCHQGPPHARVTRVTVDWVKPEEYRDFRIAL